MQERRPSAARLLAIVAIVALALVTLAPSALARDRGALGGSFTVTHDAGFAAARAQAYNDWLHDYCEVCPQRLKGIGIVALQDLEGAIREMQRAVSALKMVGIQIGCTVREDTLLSDPRLAPFWAEAERLNVPIAVR